MGLYVQVALSGVCTLTWRPTHISRRGGFCRLLGIEAGIASVDMVTGATHEIAEAIFLAGMTPLTRFRSYAAEFIEEARIADEGAAANEALRAQRRKRKSSSRGKRKRA